MPHHLSNLLLLLERVGQLIHPGSQLLHPTSPNSNGSIDPRAGELRRRPSVSSGWAGLMGGASTAADPWAALTRTSNDS